MTEACCRCGHEWFHWTLCPFCLFELYGRPIRLITSTVEQLLADAPLIREVVLRRRRR